MALRPGPGIGDEVARATSIVRYAANARFSEHTHGGGADCLHEPAGGAAPARPGALADGSVTRALPGPAGDQPPALAFLSLADDVPLGLQSRLDALVGDSPALAFAIDRARSRDH